MSKQNSRYLPAALLAIVALPGWALLAGCGGGGASGGGGGGRRYALTDLNPTGIASSIAVNLDRAQAAGDMLVGGKSHAVLWSTFRASSYADLNGSFDKSEATGISQGVASESVVGNGTAGSATHAILWPGGNASILDLHPPDGFSGLQWTGSKANGISGSQIVGLGTALGGNAHALLWTSLSAGSVVDLHPASGFISSAAAGTDGTHQVGSGKASPSAEHALYWSGTPGSLVDLHPPDGFANKSWAKSQAFRIAGGQIVGIGTSGSDNLEHALLWTSPAASAAVDLSPAGFAQSAALGSNGSQQVGFGETPDKHAHALVWAGTAASAVDLNAYLPAGYTDALALGIDSAGNIVGAAGTSGFDPSDPSAPTGTGHAVVWVPTGRGYRVEMRR